MIVLEDVLDGARHVVGGQHFAEAKEERPPLACSGNDKAGKFDARGKQARPAARGRVGDACTRWSLARTARPRCTAALDAPSRQSMKVLSLTTSLGFLGSTTWVYHGLVV